MNLKRAASRMTACLLLAGILITPALAATGTVNTEGSYLRLRSTPSTKGAILKNLPHNTVVDVLEVLDNGWCQVTYNGLTGYVSGDYLTISGDAAPAETRAAEAAPVEVQPEDAAPVEVQAEEAAPAVEEEALYVKVTTGTLNVRSGPGTEHSKVGTLRAGRVVQVLEVLDGWYRIEQGYICAEYTVPVDPAQAQASASKGQEIADYALQFLGYPYVHGGASPKGFDCSGFTSYVYKQFGYSLNRTCSGQLDNGTPVSMSELQPGDIVIFNKNNSSVRATHVGLYIGNNQFIHASTPTKGVIINKLSDFYYTTGFVGGRRIV